MGDNFTLFQNGSSGSGSDGPGDYTKDAFDDISLQATVNTGFSSTVSTNPLSYYFANDDQPRYLVKTLFVRDLVLVQDRSLWINSKPTYEIVWNETCPAVKGYVYGNVRLRNFGNGRCVEIKNVDDSAGISGVIRQVAWILNPSIQPTGTADFVTDGADTGTDATFGGLSAANGANGVNEYSVFLHNSVKSSYNIHDYRLQANETSTLVLSGVVCYFENATNDIDCFAGTTYVNKDKKTSTSTHLSLPTLSTKNGGKGVVYKDSNGTYTVATNPAPAIESIGVGSINTNLINTSIGSGASFPIGSGIVGAAGTSLYFGIVTNQSTDTLTVSPTLAFGISGPLYKYFSSGSTQSILNSFYTLALNLNPQLLNNMVDSQGFAVSATGDYEYSSPNGRYRVWGSGLAVTAIDGYPGVTFQGATTGFLQVTGKYSAIDIELSGSGINNHTVYANGLTLFVMNEGFTGIIKKTIFTDAGPGMNNVVIAPGTSLGNCAITAINMYDMRPPVGVSFGKLAEFDIFTNTVTRAAENTTLMTLGNNNRIFADRLGLYGSWTRGASTTVAGGIFYVGASTNSVLKFQYFGTNFALVGTAGNSTICTLDGASFSSAFNAYNSGISLGFHTIVVTNQGTSGTIINSLDYMGATFGDFKCVQNYLPRQELDDAFQFYIQSDTPRNPKNGDIWCQQNALPGLIPKTWISIGGKWNLMSFTATYDDPNTLLMVKTHGSSTAQTMTGSDFTTEHFNFFTWSSGTNDTLKRSRVPTGELQVAGLLIVPSGVDETSTLVGTTRRYNKYTWSAGSAPSTSRTAGGGAKLLNKLYVAGGDLTANSGTATNAIDSYDGTTWVSGLGPISSSRINLSGFVQGGFAHFVGGSGSAVNDKFNGNTNTTDTVAPNANAAYGGVQSSAGSRALMVQSNAATASTAYEFDGTTWSASKSFGYTIVGDNGQGVSPQNAYNPLNGTSYFNGGSSAATTSISTSQKYDGTSFSSVANSAVARASGTAAIF